MSIILVILSWIFGVLFLLLAILSTASGKLLPALIMVVLALLLLPPVRAYAHTVTGKSLPIWGRGILVIVLLALYLASLMIFPVMAMKDVYASPADRENHLAIYDSKLEKWPTPYEDIYVDTSFGKVHVIASGPEDALPVLLFNAAAMSGWSWLYNVGELNQYYRTYAVDTLGEVGKSTLHDINVIPTNGKELADLYIEVANALGIEKSIVVGASMGGYIGTSYALHYPERVEKLALLGPMGMTPQTAKTALRIMIAQFFPLRPIQNNTVTWALGEDPFVLEECEEWFRIVLTRTTPREPQPVTFTPEQLQSLEVPVLLIIGTRDALTGDPEAVKELALNTPDIQIEVLDSGHLIGMEQADRSNELMINFFAPE